MALRSLRLEGDEILRKRSKEVTVIDKKIKSLINDMLETMYEYDGVGLAAVQIGILKRIVVINVDDENEYKMINPVIIETSGEQIDEEGCLSIPKTRDDVVRPQKVKVKYIDENGDEVVLEAEDLLARCICHELDHLDGVLFIDRVKKSTKVQSMNKRS